MRYIVDSNYLQSDELIKILSNPNNEVVLCEQVSMEALRSDMLKSFKILARYPKQIHVLKTSRKIMKLSLNSKGLQKRLIDHNDTKRFRELCKMIDNPTKRDAWFNNQNSLMKQESVQDLATIQSNIEKMNEQILEYFSKLSKAEKKALRRRHPYGDATISLILKNLEKMTLQLFSSVVDFSKKRNFEEFYNSYLFRGGVCHYFLMQDLYLAGGLQDLKSKKLLNDVLDMQIAGYATYFDGLLTNDKKAQRIYKVAKYFIEQTVNA